MVFIPSPVYMVNFISSPAGHCQLLDKHLFWSLLPETPLPSLLPWQGFLDLSIKSPPWRVLLRAPIHCSGFTAKHATFTSQQELGGWAVMTMGTLFLMAGLGRVKNSGQEGGTLCRFTCSFIYSLPVYPGPAVYRGLCGSWSHNQE